MNELYSSGTIRDYTKVSWEYTRNGFIAVSVGTYLNLVSTDDWGTFAYVPDCYGYLEDRDFFVCYDYSSSNRTYAGFQRYSLEALTNYGRSLLNGWEMSEAQKLEYGLS